MYNNKDILHTEFTQYTHIGQSILNSITYRTDENAVVSITEMVDLSKPFRTCDEQSGGQLIFRPMYSVRTYRQSENKRIVYSELTMSMEEVFARYPWFFEILRSI